MDTPNYRRAPVQSQIFDDIPLVEKFVSPPLKEDEARAPSGSQEPSVRGRALKTPVETLATVPAEGHKITHLGSKFFSVMMHIAQQQGAPNEEGGFEAPLNEIYQRAKFTSRNIKHARETIKSMVSTLVEWQSPTSSESSQWGVTSMLSQATIETTKTGTTLKWWYSPKILHQVLEPHPYARVDLDMMFELNSYAAEMLFKIGSRYVSSETGFSPKKPWWWWCAVLTGSAETGRVEPEFKVFNRSKLKPAIDRVNLKSNIYVEPVYFRSGTKITDIQFRFRRKGNPVMPGKEIKNEAQLKIVGRALAVGIAQSEIESVLTKLAGPVIDEALDVMTKRVSQLPKVDRPFDYFKRVAYNVGPKKPVQSFDAGSGLAIDKKTEDRAADYRKTVVITAYRDFKRNEAYELYSESSDEEKAETLLQFKETLSEKLKQAFEKNGVKSNMLMGLFKQYLVVSTYGPDWGKPNPEVLHDFFVRNIEKIKF